MAWSPIERVVTQYVDGNGDTASGFVLKFYANGTSTNIPLATDSTGGTTATDVALNATGYPEISGNIVIPHLDQDYKIALYPTQAAADADTGATWTIDNVSIGQATNDEWRDSGLTPTFISTTSFSLSGDQTADFHVGLRLQLTDSGGTDYATILTTAFTTLTTVTIALDGGGVLDSGLSAVSFSILSADNPSMPAVWEKGTDVASATDLDVTGVGNYYDVTGTTTIETIKGKNLSTPIKLHFDGILTLTHDATNLILPTGANITTAAGDECEFVEYQTDDWRCVNYERASGLPLTAPDLDWQLISSATASTSATIDFESLSSTYIAYQVIFTGVVPDTDAQGLFLRIGTGAGPTYQSGAADYSWQLNGAANNANQVPFDASDDHIAISPTGASGLGTGTGEDAAGRVTIYNPASATVNTTIWTEIAYKSAATHMSVYSGADQYNADTAVTAIRFFMASGNLSVGEFRLYGLRAA